MKRRLRNRSEHVLRLAALDDLGRGQPSTARYAPEPGGALWRRLFVPVYRRVPWAAKRRAMETLGMTATGWQAPAREPGEPWRPPPVAPGALPRPVPSRRDWD